MCISIISSCADETAVNDLNKLRLTTEDFSVKAVIGRGHFGEVMNRFILIHLSNTQRTQCLQVQVVHEKSTGDVYAMKVMKKSHILQQADVRYIICYLIVSSSFYLSMHFAGCFLSGRT